MIYCNGSPKTGTHALLKALWLFGGEYKLAIHSHTSHKDKVTGARYINIFRSPRNVIGSWLKFTTQEVTESNMIKVIPDLVREQFDYAGWWVDKDPNILNIKYEELLTLPKVVDDIQSFLNKDKKAGSVLAVKTETHYKDIWGGTPTFTGNPFIWRDNWSNALETTWINAGGLILEDALEYDPKKVWIRKKP